MKCVEEFERDDGARENETLKQDYYDKIDGVDGLAKFLCKHAEFYTEYLPYWARKSFAIIKLSMNKYLIFFFQYYWSASFRFIS